MNRRQKWFLSVFLIVASLFLITFRLAVVQGSSMEPTYYSGQLVLVRRPGMFHSPLRRGDVVLLRRGGEVLIKRVHRLPGEELDDAFPYVLSFTNRDLLRRYLIRRTPSPDGPQTRWFVPPGRIVVIGDNLLNSEDSRVFGPVPIRDVLGTIVNAPSAPYIPAPPPRPATRTLAPNTRRLPLRTGSRRHVVTASLSA